MRTRLSVVSFRGPMQIVASLAPHARTMALEPWGKVFCLDSGRVDPASPVVLLLHGLQDEADTWRHVLPTLAKHHRVIAPDLPGFGRSDKSAGKYGVEDYATFVTSLLDYLNIERCGIVGNSMGAFIAELVALTAPQRVWAIALLDGTLQLTKPPPSPLPLWKRVLMGAKLDRAYFESLRAAPPQASFDTLRPFYADLDALPEDDRAFLFQRVNERVWDEAQRLAALSIQRSSLPFFVLKGGQLRQMIKRLTTPALLVWGASDRIMPIENLRPRADAQPSARSVILPGVGHLPQQEHPERLLAELLPFLSDNTP